MLLVEDCLGTDAGCVQHNQRAGWVEVVGELGCCVEDFGFIVESKIMSGAVETDTAALHGRGRVHSITYCCR